MNRRRFLASALTLGTLSAVPFIAGCPSAQNWIETAEADLPTIQQIISVTLAVVLPAAGVPVNVGPEVDLAFKLVSAGLITVDQILQDYKANPTATTLQKIQIAVQDTLAKTNAILKIVVPNDQIAQIIAAAVASVASLLSSVLLLVPNAKTARVGATPKSVHVPTKTELKTNFNTVLRSNGYSHLELR